MKNNKPCLRRQGFAPIAIVLIIIAVLAVGGVTYYVKKSSNTLPKNTEDIIQPVNNDNGNQKIGCTKDAKMCPDGSPVGRSGPNCEFICPEVKSVENKENSILEDNLVNNVCEKNDDCKYIWYTGGCNTPEYVAKKQKEAQEQGMHISEAQPQENVTCACENNKCVTHN